MADVGLEVVSAQVGAQGGAEVMRGGGLAEAADVVAAAFDRQQEGVADGAGVDGFAAVGELSGRELGLVEGAVDGLHDNASVRARKSAS